LKSEFQTNNGRVVYDGGGIDPDIEIEEDEMAPVTYALYTQGHIFDYATKYFYEHPEIKAAKEFDLSDAEYESFTKWLQDRDYSYSTDVEQILDVLEKNAKKEKYYEDIEPKLIELHTKLSKSKSSDLIDFKSQIKILLEEEIASRYYFEGGTVEATFGDDKVIQTAISVLNDSKKYNTILQ